MNIEQKCRTCMSINQDLNSPFNEEMVNNKPIMYSEMIYLCTNIQVI